MSLLPDSQIQDKQNVVNAIQQYYDKVWEKGIWAEVFSCGKGMIKFSLKAIEVLPKKIIKFHQ